MDLDHPFNEHIANVCKGRAGVAVRPGRGAAIMFDSMMVCVPRPRRRTSSHHESRCYLVLVIA